MARVTKKDDIKKSAMGLFKRFGMKKVTIKEICESAKTSKVTFYKHYNNKNELIFDLLTEIHEQGMKTILTIWESDINIKDKFREFIKLKLYYYNMFGENFIHDLLHFKDIQHYNNEMIENNLLCMRNFIKEEQEKGNIRNNLKVDFILAIFTKSFDIMRDPVFSKIYDDPKELVNAIIEVFVFGIINEK